MFKLNDVLLLVILDVVSVDEVLVECPCVDEYTWEVDLADVIVYMVLS